MPRWLKIALIVTLALVVAPPIVVATGPFLPVFVPVLVLVLRRRMRVRRAVLDVRAALKAAQR